MVKSWGIQRKISRVALNVPIHVEVLDSDPPVEPFNALAEDISRDGFRIKADTDDASMSGLAVGKRFRVIMAFGKRKLNATIEIMWRNETHIGVHFIERDKGWIIS
jgi:hypothetical protein